MASKKLVKAFIAGMALPAFVIPIVYAFMFFQVRNPIARNALLFLPMFLPLAWGLANTLFVKLHNEAAGKNANNGLTITGACLGFLIAVFGVFIVRVPAVVFGKTDAWQYAPLIIVPIIYAILFRYVVKYLNKLVGV